MVELMASAGAFSGMTNTSLVPGAHVSPAPWYALIRNDFTVDQSETLVTQVLSQEPPCQSESAAPAATSGRQGFEVVLYSMIALEPVAELSVPSRVIGPVRTGRHSVFRLPVDSVWLTPVSPT